MGLEDIVNFTSLGMIVIDHIHFPSGKVVENVIGGSGAYGKLVWVHSLSNYLNCVTQRY